MGIISTAIALGYLLAPVLGGVIYTRIGYYATFGITFGVLAPDFLLRLVVIEKTVEAHPPPTAVPLEGPNGVLWKLLRTPLAYAIVCAVFLNTTSLTILDNTLAIFVQEVFHWDALGAGLAFFPPLAPGLLGGYFIGWAVDRYGTRWPAVVGFVICVPSWILLRVVTHDTMGQKVLFAVLLFGVGTGSEIVTVSTMTECRSLCPTSLAMGFAVFNIPLAASIIFSVVSSTLQQSGGWSLTTLIPGLFSAAGILCAVWFRVRGSKASPEDGGDV
ncbi:uncharacterized protein PV07_12697 [Cladophialophora immunda]|uniref:Major facilitator superfamily (MFS) profile domain-containing protein n=1 Tax=Cladophialophora immunda TaxID=569365 RepID=A0A0D2AAU5_9EURO|nr:uncharacterized protein PV07_12697 [Cladophialophora immunda]KIW21892.1 hypothetical protein PV07_12697 [Cladophialophora immunda]